MVSQSHPAEWLDPELQDAITAILTNGNYQPVLQYFETTFEDGNGFTGTPEQRLLLEGLKRACQDLARASQDLAQHRTNLLVGELFARVYDLQFDTSQEPTGPNTSNPAWPEVPYEYIEEMDDCTFETIQGELGFLFGLTTSETDENIRKKLEEVQIYVSPTSEAEIQFAAQAYLLPVIQSAFNASYSLLADMVCIPHNQPFEIKGLESGMNPAEKPTEEHIKTKSRYPDWSMFFPLARKQREYVSVGETKMDSKWDSSFLPTVLGSQGSNIDMMWPIRQQANYCRVGNTSWSFIYTPTEVVLCRFYLLPTNSTIQIPVSHMGMKWKSFPLPRAENSDRIGPIMAIWSWIVFAFLDQNRNLGPKSELRKLTDIVPKRPSEVVDMLNEAAEQGPTAVDESKRVDIVSSTKGTGEKKPRKRKWATGGVNVWEGRLRPRPKKVVVCVALP